MLILQNIVNTTDGSVNWVALFPHLALSPAYATSSIKIPNSFGSSAVNLAELDIASLLKDYPSYLAIYDGTSYHNFKSALTDEVGIANPNEYLLAKEVQAIIKGAKALTVSKLRSFAQKALLNTANPANPAADKPMKPAKP